MKMSEDGSNQISARINQKLAALSKTSNNTFIFKIHHLLRRENEGAYEPEMLSIGPYHHGKNNLQKMEKYKLEYLQGILERQKTGAERYIPALMKVVEEAECCYAEQLKCTRDAFAEMMLLDGCFIIEFLWKYNTQDQENLDDDPIFSKPWLVEVLCRDLLLFENQLPFFILAKLFDMTKIPGRDKDLIQLAISCLNHCIADDKPSNHYEISEPENIYHLLDLMHKSWCSQFAKGRGDRSSILGQKSCCSSVITFCSQLKRTLGNQEQDQEDVIDFIKSVRELEENGIKFKAAKQVASWLHISFENGVMEIPTLVVEDRTESLLRNLIAYEQYMSECMFDQGFCGKFVTDYTTFMDYLINSPEDVKRLRHEQIIKSWLGNDEAISSMFNKIGNNVFVSSWSTYSEVFKDVNKYCSQKRHTWKADLKKKYFSNPWSIISLVAATILLLLTLSQTVFAVIQHVKEKKGKNGCV